MVGFLGTGSRNSPATGSPHPDTTSNTPPQANGSARVFSDKSAPNRSAGQPQNTSDNSHSTLHFFSLPHWTRKMLPVSVSARRNQAGMPSDELGVVRRRPSKLMLDKELPPTPPIQSLAGNSDSAATSLHISSPISTNRSTPSPTFPRANIPSTSAEPRHAQPTLYFDVYHNAVPRGVNTVSFVTASPPTNDQHDSAPPLRHARSTQSFLSHKQADRSMHPLNVADRVRGLSIGQRLSPRLKDAEPPPTGGNNESSPVRQVSKKSSQQLLSVPSDSLSLPALQPTSPFRIDFHSDTPASSQQLPQRSTSRLTRSHSERFARRPSPSNCELPASPKIISAFDSSQHHSTTADSQIPSHHLSRPALRRPMTADSTRSRTRSFFTLSPQTTPGPSTHTPHFGNALSSLTSSTSANHTNNRPRSATNPPLLHRLSINFFASSPASAKAGTIPGGSITASPVSRSRPPLLSSVPPEELRPQQDELPEAFLQRLTSLVGKADVAGLLGSSTAVKYVATLKLYIGKFSFTGDPLDVALRRLLMHIGLPRETQQIDRVIEAFAKRYVECNPDIFMSDDIPYILAFSLIMLHTDAFNKSNKRKMTKADYQKNTAVSGVIPEVLDCFYDNIVFAPFIFIEDPMDPPRPSVDGSLSRPPTSAGVPMTPVGGTLLSRPKIDPYYLITNDLLDSLRVNVEQHIPLDNPYRWEGTSGSWDNDKLWSAFAEGDTIEISCFEHKCMPSGLFGLSVASPSLMGTTALPGFLPPQKETWRLKLSKVSVLNRKDDILEGGKKPSNRKWKSFGVALTTSQVLLFRDPSWAATFLSTSDYSRQPTLHCKPDEVLSVKDALAVFDRSYQKHPNTFRLALADGRQILFQASSELEVNQWVSRINYASAFKSAGIRMRPPGMTGREVTLTGLAAAQSHLQDLRLVQQSQPKIRSWGSQSSLIRATKSTDEDAVERSNPEIGSELEARHDITHEPPAVREIEGASQFKATFDKVKAQLTAARLSLCDSSLPLNDASDDVVRFPVRRSSLTADDNSPPQSNRTILLQSTIGDLEDRICVMQPLLETKMHFARNVSVLTPFQRSTRDRLQDAVQIVAKQISQLRLEIARLICHRNVLLNDVAAEERGFKQAATIALNAAMDTLQSRGQRIPEPTSSPDDGSLDVPSYQPSSKAIPSSLESSVHDSFRSALDFGPDWPTNYTFSVSRILEPTRITDSPLTEGEGSGYPFLEADTSLSESRTAHSVRSSLELSVQDGTPHSTHEKFYTAQESPEEQAEEWNKTRAAKRVSLVKLPPDIRLSAMFGKTQRNGYNDLISTMTREDSSFG
ncbi:hypothetical protein DEU56DRAFT_860628 [Suillus clintonianus]|uniref:uncharacterized protein n=1 Tax=Suillus clintonianus TaxID=1904413 RepID=UPI001B85F0E3|nr:uncharacterized protein DEU56DRAFT_860628 [Suillus clintonianus]KAG2129928.1 hypothetical protein DEU56DRAFT_860628 [Suillus clintonianus]